MGTERLGNMVISVTTSAVSKDRDISPKNANNWLHTVFSPLERHDGKNVTVVCLPHECLV